MNEEEARSWIEARFGPTAAALLDRYASLVVAENERQNLIAPSTIVSIWVRHLLDSAQLVPLAFNKGVWIDIGSGAGLPGIVVAILRPAPILLVEPRRQRAAFLTHCRDELALGWVDVRVTKIEAVAQRAAVISARAVAPVEKLLQAAAACSTNTTRWLLPRGRFGPKDLAALRQRWGGLFHMKQSVTDPASTILVCDGPARR